MAKTQTDADAPDFPPISDAVNAKLVDTLFAQQSSIIFGAAGAVGLSLFCYIRNHQLWMGVWMVAMIVACLGRLALARAYGRRDPLSAPLLWANRFMLASSANALIWGLASAASVFFSDPFTQMAVITGQGAYLSGAAVRNSTVPRASRLQVIIPLGVLAIACLAKGDVYYRVYALFIGLHVMVGIQIISFLSRKTTDLLVAEERAAQIMEDLAEANRQLELLVTTDGLTGVTNRRGFDMTLARQWGLGIDDHRDVSLLLLDIDLFKALNDTFGHPAGDACLCQIADCLRETITRRGDLVARYGGEEFAIILPNTDYAGAGRVAKRVREAIEALGLPHPTSPSRATTISVGYTTWEPQAPIDSAAVIKLADEALYIAKTTGRNKVVGSRPALESDNATAKVVALRPDAILARRGTGDIPATQDLAPPFLPSPGKRAL